MGAQLCPGSLAAPTPQAFDAASPPADLVGFGVGRPGLATAVHCIPAHIRQVRGRYNAYGALHAGSSRTPSGLACRTRAVWQCRRVPSLSGLLPALTGVPRIGLPPASSGCCDSLTVKSFHLHSVTQNFVAHQPVVVLGRIVDPVGITQQRAKQRAQLQQLMPVLP